jgi:hypothetical protein
MAANPETAVTAWKIVSVNAELSITPAGMPIIPHTAVPMVTMDAQIVLDKYHGFALFMR